MLVLGTAQCPNVLLCIVTVFRRRPWCHMQPGPAATAAWAAVVLFALLLGSSAALLASLRCKVAHSSQAVRDHLHVHVKLHSSGS